MADEEGLRRIGVQVADLLQRGGSATYYGTLVDARAAALGSSEGSPAAIAEEIGLVSDEAQAFGREVEAFNEGHAKRDRAEQKLKLALDRLGILRGQLETIDKAKEKKGGRSDARN